MKSYTQHQIDILYTMIMQSHTYKHTTYTNNSLGQHQLMTVDSHTQRSQYYIYIYTHTTTYGHTDIHKHISTNTHTTHTHHIPQHNQYINATYHYYL